MKAKVLGSLFFILSTGLTTSTTLLPTALGCSLPGGSSRSLSWIPSTRETPTLTSTVVTSLEVTWLTTCATSLRRMRMPTRSSSPGTSRMESPLTAWRTCTRSATPPSARTHHPRLRPPPRSPRRGGTLPRLDLLPGRLRSPRPRLSSLHRSRSRRSRLLSHALLWGSQPADIKPCKKNTYPQFHCFSYVPGFKTE